MAFLQHYNGTLTAGTEVKSSTTGFVCPKGFAGILAVAKTGAGSEYLDIKFPGSEHQFNLEQPPTTGEIAVETRVNDLVLTPCNWSLPEGTRLDVTPRGAESSTEGNIFVLWARPGEIQGPGIHWMHAAVTTGTTAENAVLVTVPSPCSSMAYNSAHGANQEVLYYRFAFNGQDYAIIANHGATNAAEEQVRWYPVNEPVVPGQDIYYGAYTTGHGAGAAGHIYFGFGY